MGCHDLWQSIRQQRLEVPIRLDSGSCDYRERRRNVDPIEYVAALLAEVSECATSKFVTVPTRERRR